MAQQPKKRIHANNISTLTEPGRYHDGKGAGLFLWVKPNGSRFWVQRIMVHGRRQEFGLGSPKTTTLAQARDKALDNKRLALVGKAPEKESDKRKRLLTFEEAAKRAHVEVASTLRNPKDKAAFLSTLERYIFPKFGKKPLQDVTSAEIRQAILAARAKVPGVARKLTFRVAAVFRWGIAEGHCTDNPATSQALALPRDTHKATKRKALPYREVAHCIDVVKASGAWTSTKLALEFLILTAARSGEVRLANWEEIQTEMNGQKVWVVPAERVKQARDHRVPLSARAVEILSEAENLRDKSDKIFPAVRGDALSDATLSKLVKELGFDVDVHGFRTSFRTWGQEQTNYSREMQEAALGHMMGDAAEQAYARSDFYDKRRKMMDSWASFLALSAVVTLGKVKEI